MTFRKRFFILLEMRNGNAPSGRILNSALMLLILINVLAVILESEDSIRAGYGIWLAYVEVGSVAVFTIEYLFRLWVCVEDFAFGSGWRGRLRYAVSPLALIDLLAILPFWLSMFLPIDTRILRVLRLLRIFKLSRHFAVLELLGSVLRNEAKILISAIFLMIVLVVLASAGIYVVERTAQPEVFGSIPRAMWWATVTLTTVGYGDVVPITVAGRMFGIVITVLGVGMAALPAGIIASGFTTEFARRREAYVKTARRVLRDGEIDAQDRRDLLKAKDELGLERVDVQQLLRTVQSEVKGVAQAAKTHCPHCGEPLT